MQRSVICANCGKTLNQYYSDLEGILCLTCLVAKHHGIPKGKESIFHVQNVTDGFVGKHLAREK